MRDHNVDAACRHERFLDEQITAHSENIPNCPAVADCLCYGSAQQCVCGLTEKALRAWIAGKLTPMTAGQREWCLAEIDSVEGYRREDYETYPDELLARGVLSAWVDYCRDKGML